MMDMTNDKSTIFHFLELSYARISQQIWTAVGFFFNIIDWIGIEMSALLFNVVFWCQTNFLKFIIKAKSCCFGYKHIYIIKSKQLQKEKMAIIQKFINLFYFNQYRLIPWFYRNIYLSQIQSKILWVVKSKVLPDVLVPA